MKIRTLKPMIAWLGHKHRSEDALCNLNDWVKESNTALSVGRRYNLSVVDEQKEIDKRQNEFLQHISVETGITVFLIVVWETHNIGYVKELIEKTKSLAKGDNQSRVYTILLDDLGQSSNVPFISYRYEKNVTTEDALPCHCEKRMTVIGTRRCVSLIERIMGYDIGDGFIFPDYNNEMLLKIAYHINREGFNKYGPRKYAWKKYAISSKGIPVIPQALLD